MSGEEARANAEDAMKDLRDFLQLHARGHLYMAQSCLDSAQVHLGAAVREHLADMVAGLS